jgi:ribonuclease P protein component
MRSGQKLKARLIDVRRLDSTAGYPRAAIVVPKFGYTIVRRNKLKRRLRELTRQLVLPQSCSCDLLLRARRDAYEASFARLREDVKLLTTQLAS